MKRFLLIFSMILISSVAFSFSFFGQTDKQTSLTTNQNIPEKDIDVMNKTVNAVQRYYIKDISDQKLMDNALRGMISQLDPHSAFLDKEALAELETTVSGEFVGIGVELTTDRGMLRIISPIADTPASKAGLKAGDLIIKVDSKLIQQMTVNEAIRHIKGKPGTVVTLTILRKNVQKPLVISMKREVVKIQAVKSDMLTPGFGYIRLSIFQGPLEKQVAQAIEQLKKEAGGNLKGLVLDLRNNPGGLLDVSADVVDLFLDKNETNRYQNLIVYTKGRIASSTIRFHAKNGDMIAGVPMVVLINGGAASPS